MQKYHLQLVTMICLAAISLPVPAAELSEGDVAAINAHMSIRYFDEDTAENLAEKYGIDAVPVLISMLEDEKTPPIIKGKTSFYLGKIGDPRAFDPMVQVIEAELPESMDMDEDSALHFTMVGLGFLGTDDAFSYLRKLAGEDYWLQRSSQPTIPSMSRDAAATRRGFRESAVMALGFSGKEKAAEILEDLRRDSAADIAKKVNAAIAELEKRQKGSHLIERDKYIPIMADTPATP